jgi:hypothetical protein
MKQELKITETEQEQYNELSLYTLEHAKGDPSFIHQYVVDAFAAQNADEKTKPIKITFALVGLYLHLEKNYTGKRVQEVHMKMGRKKRQWPEFDFPNERGNIRVADVLKAEPGEKRDKMIEAWCASVWKTWESNREKIVKLLEEF